MDFNETRLHEATFNLHTHAWIFSQPVKSQESSFLPKKVWIKCWSIVVPSFSLQLKSDESIKHYLTQMLLAINWRYWQAAKIHVCVWMFKVVSCKRASLKSTRFPQRIRSDTFLTEWHDGNKWMLLFWLTELEVLGTTILVVINEDRLPLGSSRARRDQGRRQWHLIQNWASCKQWVSSALPLLVRRL